MKKILIELKNFDEKILSVMKSCLKYSFWFLIIATIVLFTYEVFYTIPNLFYIGLSLFRTGLYLIVACFICGLAFNRIQKELKF